MTYKRLKIDQDRVFYKYTEYCQNIFTQHNDRYGSVKQSCVIRYMGYNQKALFMFSISYASG